jgi:hypothetical protein
MSQKDLPVEFLESLSEQKTCGWCRYPLKRVYRAGLCRHCYDIRLEVNRLRKKVEAAKIKGGGHPRFGPVPFELDFDYRVALEMEKDAKIEGQTYGEIATRTIYGLELETEMSFLSKQFLKKDLYYGEANLFDWSFSPDQKKVLFYLLSLMIREQLRKTRRFRARYAPI